MKWYYINHEHITPNPEVLKVYKHYNFSGNRILELGAFEALDTFTMHQYDPKEIVSIEGSAENFEKCQYMQEHYNLNKAKFLHRDMEQGLTDLGHFDFCLARGIIHHLANPVKVLTEIASMTDRLWLGIRIASDTFPTGEEVVIDGYKGKKLYFNETAYHLGIHGYGVWLYRNEALRLLRNLGFVNIVIVDDVEKNCEQTNYHNIFAYREATFRVPIKEFERFGKFCPFQQRMSDLNFQRLEDRIRAEGDTNPVDVIYLPKAKCHFLIDGRHRLEKAKKVGLKTLQCRYAQRDQLVEVMCYLLRYMESGRCDL